MWAQALHAALSDIDGLLWMSRQFNASTVLVHLGDRVDERSLTMVEASVPIQIGDGRQKIDRVANSAVIAIG